MKLLLALLLACGAVALVAALRARVQPLPQPASPGAGALPAPEAATGLYEAAVRGDAATVRRRLAEDPDAVDARDAWGFTALHGVVSEEHVGIAVLLLDAGADADARNDEGVAPLHLALWPDMADLLLDRGADIDARDQRGRTPLHAAIEHPETIDVAERLLQRGADAGARDVLGETPMDYARSRGETDKIGLLQRHGAQR